MRPSRMKVTSSVLLVLVLALGSFALKLIADAGAFKAITPHFEGSCRELSGIAGPEDVDYSPSTHLLFISSDHRAEHEGIETLPGAILAFDLSNPTALPVTLTRELPFEFHPHGISVRDTFRGPRLWVVNHRRSKDTIEVFDYDKSGLVHVKTLEDPLLINTNDVAAVSDDAFYATHDHGSRDPVLNRLEDYTRIGRGYVSFFDGKRFQVKSSGIRFANGITLDPKSGKVLIASMLGRSVQIYQRDPATDELKLEKEIAVGTSPDNILFNEKGELWVAAHPKLFALKAQSHDHARRGPAQVLRIRDWSGTSPRIDEVFLDDGVKFSGASVAFNLGDRLILGSVFDERLLDCKLSR